MEGVSWWRRGVGWEGKMDVRYVLMGRNNRGGMGGVVEGGGGGMVDDLNSSGGGV